MSSYDLSKFHPDCSEIQIVATADAVYAFCKDCQVLAEVEAIAMKVSPEDACSVANSARKDIAQQSPGVDKGGKK